METMSMEKLQDKYNYSNGVVTRFKDNVVVAKYKGKTYSEPKAGYVCEVYTPIETEEETGYEFMELRLELSHNPKDVFETAGEALALGFEYVKKDSIPKWESDNKSLFLDEAAH